MARRSIPQKKLHDLSFPVRVKIKVPGAGLGGALTDALLWLQNELGRGEFAQHAERGIASHAASFYFRDLEAAQRFVAAFPMMELADEVGVSR